MNHLHTAVYGYFFSQQGFVQFASHSLPVFFIGATSNRCWPEVSNGHLPVYAGRLTRSGSLVWEPAVMDLSA